MWKAYQLTQTIDDLTWEEILDWKLEFSSWGALAQLNRMSDFLEDYGIRELVALVASEEYSLGNVRTAARNVLRYEADFEDALQRIADGASTGELGQFYKLIGELEVEPEVLDQYLADGVSLAELRHAVKLSERVEGDWTEVIESKTLNHSWGEIAQAYKLADDGTSAEDILALGVKEYRTEQREEERAQREEERNIKTAERLGEQLELQAGDLLAILHGECEGSWSCVRKKAREEERAQGSDDRDLRTANQLASKYGISADEVMKHFHDCDQNWNCVRTNLRELFQTQKAPGKDKKK
jgi:hypothetical protein